MVYGWYIDELPGAGIVLYEKTLSCTLKKHTPGEGEQEINKKRFVQ